MSRLTLYRMKKRESQKEDFFKAPLVYAIKIEKDFTVLGKKLKFLPLSGQESTKGT